MIVKNARILFLLGIIIWSLAMLYINVPLVFFEEPIDDQIRSVEGARHLLIDAKEDKIPIQTQTLSLLTQYAEGKYIAEWRTRFDLIFTAILLLVTAIIPLDLFKFIYKKRVR